MHSYVCAFLFTVGTPIALQRAHHVSIFFTTIVCMYLFASEGDNDKMKISDCTTLETFLKCEQDREHKVLSSSPNVTGSPLSCDQYGSDFAPTPRKYHLSTRSLPSCLTEGDSLLSSDSRIVSIIITLYTLH